MEKVGNLIDHRCSRVAVTEMSEEEILSMMKMTAAHLMGSEGPGWRTKIEVAGAKATIFLTAEEAMMMTSPKAVKC